MTNRIETQEDAKRHIHLGAMDLKIIKALKNGRRPMAEIAEEVGLPLSTTRRHVQRMLNDNAIQIICLVDPFLIQGHSSAFISFKFEPGKIHQGAKRIENLRGVVISALVSGSYDAMAIVLFNDSFTLQNFIMEEILKLEGLVDIEAFIAIEGGKNYQLRYVL
ncbi:Lrp/AsnC family transcriptional regulator [Kushneria aurantia]|uniref:Lrp/AsnC family transcriptional regulator n=1 Tax=Kushneria aurantia TaxID=504092 RepID=A0ABV6FZU4_9GAMM|nr:Lrp/AsnC family transcriptional regulator [Kushneria aurantia]